MQIACRNFVWILKSQTLRCVELIMEGHPSQDVLVERELQQDDADGEVTKTPHSNEWFIHDEEDEATADTTSVDTSAADASRGECLSTPAQHSLRSHGHLLRAVEQSTVGHLRVEHDHPSRNDQLSATVGDDR